MKKVLAMLMAVILLLTAAGCGSKGDTQQSGEEAAQNAETTTESNVVESERMSFELLHCKFTKVVYPADIEYQQHSGGGYTEREGKVFVDLALRVTNKTDEELTEDDFSAYFIYGDLRYDMQFTVENYTGKHFGGVNVIGSNQSAVIHLFDLVEDVARNTEITVCYTVDGETYEEKVENVPDITTPLDYKTEVRAGDVVDVNGLYTFEVLECGITEYLRASNAAESDQYMTYGGVFADVKIKLTNNSPVTLGQPEPYTIIDGEIHGGGIGIEVENGTKIGNNVVGIGEVANPDIEPGGEYVCHVYVVVDEENTDNVIVRFNIDGNCYYCQVS